MKLLTLLFKKVNKISRSKNGFKKGQISNFIKSIQIANHIKIAKIKQQNKALVARLLKSGSFKKSQGRSRMAELLIKLQPGVKRDAKGI